MSTVTREGLEHGTGRPVRLTCVDGKIRSIEPLAGTPAAGLPRLLPPLIDIQINGYAAVDFQRDDCTLAELEQAAAGLAAGGCGRFFATFITNRWPRMLASVRHFRELRAQSPRLRRRLAGWHLEGPFMSPKPGFHGAHPPECMEPPSAEKLHELKAIVGDDPTLLTMAPEWPEAPAAIRVARALGFRVWLGHTDATAEQLAVAIDAGAEGMTHLGNGCPGQMHRHDNIIFRTLDEPRLRASIIPDRIHVSAPVFRVMHQVLDDARICYTTDAMSAAGAGPGVYELAGMKVEVGADGVVRQPGKTNFAGSSLVPIEGIRRAAEMLRRPPAGVWGYFSTQLEKFMGLPPALTVGAPADFCVLHETAAATRVEICFVDEPPREVVWPK